MIGRQFDCYFFSYIYYFKFQSAFDALHVLAPPSKKSGWGAMAPLVATGHYLNYTKIYAVIILRDLNSRICQEQKTRF